MAARAHQLWSVDGLDDWLSRLSNQHADPGRRLHALIDAGLDQLPAPGSGRTLQRWQALARIGATDLSLAKLYEGHTDALAILQELPHQSASLDSTPRAGRRWGVWCAQPLGETLLASSDADGVRLDGVKSWCSGASSLTHALVSCVNQQGERCLAALALEQPGVRFDRQHWHAVGMRDSDTWTLHCHGAPATLVGPPGSYLTRPGFQHGAGGIAACWHGALTCLVQAVRSALIGQPHADPHRLAHLGAMDVSLHQAALLLREAAAVIDAHPRHPGTTAIQRARLGVEAAAEDILRRLPRALGPAPLCTDATLARAMADLPVFIRQSHAERDQARHGEHLLQEHSLSWSL